jgi:hypothetical protein
MPLSPYIARAYGNSSHCTCTSICPVRRVTLANMRCVSCRGVSAMIPTPGNESMYLVQGLCFEHKTSKQHTQQQLRICDTKKRHDNRLPRDYSHGAYHGATSVISLIRLENLGGRIPVTSLSFGTRAAGVPASAK